MTEGSIRRKRIIMGLVLVACAGGGYAAYNHNQQTSVVEVPVAKVRKGDFRIVVTTRGEIRSVNSTTIIGLSRAERLAQTVELAHTPIPNELWPLLDAVGYSMEDPEAARWK